MQHQKPEKHASDPSRDAKVLIRLQDAAEKSRQAFDGAMNDFRNSFTIGSTHYDQDESRD